MTNYNKTPPHIKLDDHIHVEKTLLHHLDRPGWDIITLMQDLLTSKKRVTPLLNDKEVTST